MKRIYYITILSLLLISIVSCTKSKEPMDYREYSYNFNSGTQGWEGLFSDYPKGEEAFYELEFAHSRLPEPLDTTIRAIKISGNNHSDDLLSFITTSIAQLIPNSIYLVTYDLTLASSVATNSVGIGGSPDLALGVGGIYYEPVNKTDEAGWYRTNFISQLQSHESNNIMQMVGTIGVQDTTNQFTLINRNNINNPVNLKTNEYGELWLMIGTDSGFEGTTTLYFQSINIKISLKVK